LKSIAGEPFMRIRDKYLMFLAICSLLVLLFPLFLGFEHVWEREKPVPKYKEISYEELLLKIKTENLTLYLPVNVSGLYVSRIVYFENTVEPSVDVNFATEGYDVLWFSIRRELQLRNITSFSFKINNARVVGIVLEYSDKHYRIFRYKIEMWISVREGYTLYYHILASSRMTINDIKQILFSLREVCR